MLFRNKYRIESSRLKGYDYSGPGAYYITIVTRNRECFFGEVVNDKMILNESGKIADKFWKEIPEHFPYASLDEYIVMPNHVHGIIILDTSTEKGNQSGSLSINISELAQLKSENLILISDGIPGFMTT